MNRHDPFPILERIKPAADTPLPEATLRRILGTPRRAGTGTRKRVLIVLALTAGILVSGTGIAGAAGLLPDRLAESLSFWAGETGGGVDVQTARRIAQAPGPDGRVLSVWSGRSADGDVCISPLYETPGPLDRPAPGDYHLAGGRCTPPDAPAEPFGNAGGSADGQGVHTMWVTAGGATRAELRPADGGTRPALAAEGLFFVWYRGGPATLIGYDDAGVEVGRTVLPVQTR